MTADIGGGHAVNTQVGEFTLKGCFVHDETGLKLTHQITALGKLLLTVSFIAKGAAHQDEDGKGSTLKPTTAMLHRLSWSDVVSGHEVGSTQKSIEHPLQTVDARTGAGLEVKLLGETVLLDETCHIGMEIKEAFGIHAISY